MLDYYTQNWVLKYHWQSSNLKYEKRPLVESQSMFVIRISYVLYSTLDCVSNEQLVPLNIE